MRLRGVVTGGVKGEPLLFLGKQGYNLGFREFRTTYCATRMQTYEPVADRPGEFIQVPDVTVEKELGHRSGDMLMRVYARVPAEDRRLRQRFVQYPDNMSILPAS